MGVGDTGRLVLTQIKKDLTERFVGAFPTGLRLLLVDAQLPQHHPRLIVGGTTLGQGEEVVLTPDLAEIDRAVHDRPERYAHLNWWRQGATPEDPGRAGGRMTLFYDLLRGRGESRLWRALARALQDLKEPLVYVVANIGDPFEGGLVLDLPHLVRLVAEPIPVSRLTLLLALPGANDADDLARANAFAALRELHRLTLKKPALFEYNPDARDDRLGRLTETTPIDLCYLFDARGEKVDPDWSSARTRRAGCPSRLSDRDG